MLFEVIDDFFEGLNDRVHVEKLKFARGASLEEYRARMRRLNAQFHCLADLVEEDWLDQEKVIERIRLVEIENTGRTSLAPPNTRFLH